MWDCMRCEGKVAHSELVAVCEACKARSRKVTTSFKERLLAATEAALSEKLGAKTRAHLEINRAAIKADLERA